MNPSKVLDTSKGIVPLSKWFIHSIFFHFNPFLYIYFELWGGPPFINAIVPRQGFCRGFILMEPLYTKEKGGGSFVIAGGWARMVGGCGGGRWVGDEILEGGSLMI